MVSDVTGLACSWRSLATCQGVDGSVGSARGVGRRTLVGLGPRAVIGLTGGDARLARRPTLLMKRKQLVAGGQQHDAVGRHQIAARRAVALGQQDRVALGHRARARRPGRTRTTRRAWAKPPRRPSACRGRDPGASCRANACSTLPRRASIHHSESPLASKLPWPTPSKCTTSSGRLALPDHLAAAGIEREDRLAIGRRDQQQAAVVDAGIQVAIEVGRALSTSVRGCLLRPRIQGRPTAGGRRGPPGPPRRPGWCCNTACPVRASTDCARFPRTGRRRASRPAQTIVRQRRRPVSMSKQATCACGRTSLLRIAT